MSDGSCISCLGMFPLLLWQVPERPVSIYFSDAHMSIVRMGFGEAFKQLSGMEAVAVLNEASGALAMSRRAVAIGAGQPSPELEARGSRRSNCMLAAHVGPHSNLRVEQHNMLV